MNTQTKLLKIVLLVSSLVSLFVMVAAAYQENFQGDWRQAQANYKSLLINGAEDPAARRAAAGFAIEPKQLYLQDLSSIDRCTTCHLGVENPAATHQPQPLARHSGDLLVHHPPEKFGCTICHQGQGRATVKSLAHGWEVDGSAVPHIDSRMLRGQAVYTSCGRCHSELDLYGGSADLYATTEGDDGSASKPPIDERSLSLELPGAPHLAQGKRLVIASGCLGCHKYRGRGGTLGPDLTYVGDKTKHDFDFAHVQGEHTVEQWLFEHFKFPREVSPETVMPDMSLSDEQASSLAQYMMGLHRRTAPAGFLPTPDDILATPQPARGATLYAMYCSSCHGAEGYGTTMRSELWPVGADPWGHDWDARDVMVEQRGDMEILVPSLHHSDTLAVVSDDYIRRIIAEGRPGTKMLGWATEGGLTDDEISRLVSFIRGWDQHAPDRISVSASRGDAKIGGMLFRSNCAACHGSGGEGGIGNSLNSPTFLAVASDDFLRDTIVDGRANTAMPSWREFDARELSDLLAFIRQWQPARSDTPTTLEALKFSEEGLVTTEIGHVLYNANCVTCHGTNGEGDLAPSLNTQAFLTVATDDYLVETLILGRPGTGMPSWHHLPPQDLASIVKYVRTWQTEDAKPASWYEQSVPHGDWDAGRYLFAGHCVGCHGVEGEGATGPQLRNPVFLANASDVMLRQWITYGKEGTEMLAFRKGGQGVTELTDRQIEDIIAYLRLIERTGDSEPARVAKSPHGRPEKGVALFAANCAGCHGPSGEGASGPALSNPDFLRIASDGFLMATMALGRHGTEMRPVRRGPQSILELTSDEVNDLVAFLRSWEYDPPFGYASKGRLPHRFVIPWNLSNGKVLFDSNCAGCHGTEGKGSWAPELNNEGFLAAATDGMLQATIVRGRKGTAMRPFGTGAHGLTDLSPDNIDDIVAYMRHWSKDTPSPMTIPAERSKITNRPAPSTGHSTADVDAPRNQLTGKNAHNQNKQRTTQTIIASMAPREPVSESRTAREKNHD